MSEWIDIAQWAECRALERPGIVFEIRNADGLVLTTPCVVPLPDMPFDWKTPALEFRPVTEQPALRSSPIPRPGGLTLK